MDADWPALPERLSAACDAGRGLMLAVHEAGLLDYQIERRGWYVSGRVCCRLVVTQCKCRRIRLSRDESPRSTGRDHAPAGVIFRSSPVSRAIASWSFDGRGIGRGVFIGVLPGTAHVLPGVFPETRFDQEVVEFDQRRQRYQSSPDSNRAQATGSSIHAAISATSPGSASTRTNSPEA